VRHIVLEAQDFLTLDISLALGTANSVVQVSADAPLVDSSTASVSTDLDQRRLEHLPVLGRNPYITAKLSGVFVNTGNPQFIRFADQNGTSTTSVAGGPVAANLYLVGGVPITDTNNRPIVIPTSVLIRDRLNVHFRAQTFNSFKTPLFAGPNTAFGSANFGAITAQANFPRYLQLGLHITY
jgi:trimeric autotransporter adhesin